MIKTRSQMTLVDMKRAEDIRFSFALIQAFNIVHQLEGVAIALHCKPVDIDGKISSIVELDSRNQISSSDTYAEIK
ncbi:hypothetical protein SUGI_0711880 [Cryptomeria japonica]|nr:hypothetical protein SUGI_0711880 [Cryptomeria japonica]